MTKGYSLQEDLKLLINNPKYSDIEILCEDEKKLHGCKAILAARSEIFDRELYNGMKESNENQISFPKINSSGMMIILEYTYTGSVKEESLTKDNIVEAFYAADYFQLLNLQELIIKTVKEKNYTENYSPELLSKVAEIMPLTEDNILLNLLVETVANIKINTIEFGRLSISGLRYLLSCTYKKEKPFVTLEYEVFRYSVILAAKQVSNDAYRTFMERVPTLKQIKDSIQVEKKSITDHQKVVKELEPLIKFIDFSQIKGKVLTDIIEPLEIVPTEVILNAYRQKARSNNSDSNGIRGIQKFNELQCIWDESACGSKLIIEDNGKVVYAPDKTGFQNVRAKIAFENDGIFEWDVIIEKACHYIWVGVCAENLDYENFAGHQSTGWVIGSGGHSCNSRNCLSYCSIFGDGAKITVHLDMSQRTCAFTVNGTKYPEVSKWNNLPSKLYPAIALKSPGRLRIQPHQKI
ncbi:concanavalin A-like lectin/glucanase domain-containing protein [Glomus cerebriforme]|uniref:Concanavalin A-like lectin/glucanase domain-containing protein n=1 Tax=Glomus cerebriforme TaxID=658196 RepID=A0A397SRW5_9GLOM|nr:concanavalin A-like lectin/glucanase domain-containing protein [Glomus cerebriforme]